MPGISIKITAGKTAADSSVKFEGENVDLIVNKERETFKIADWGIKKAVETYVGCWPNDVYVRDPTYWGDIFRKYNWPEVRRTLRPIRSRILGVHTKPVTIATRVFENDSQVTAQYSADMSHMIEETVSRTWSKGGELTVGQEFTYNLDFIGGSVGGKYSYSFTEKWGKDTSETKKTTLKTTTKVELPLKPKQAVEVFLTATHGTLEVEIDYQATLSGSAFANYSGKFKGHHFYAYDVNSLLEARGLPKYVNSTERISIGYYSDANIRITDK